MSEDSPISGQLVTESGDPVADATVEVWLPDPPAGAVPPERPLNSAAGPPGDDEDGDVESFLGTTRTDENGWFAVEAASRPDAVFLRVFDGESLLASTTLALADGEAVVLEVDVGGGGLRRQATLGGAALAAAAGAWYALGGFGGSGGSTGPSPGGPRGTSDADEPDHRPDVPVPAGQGASVRSVYQQGQFLYTGDDPVQTGVAEDAIDPEKAAILRGKVTDENDDPLPGVEVAVQGRPEYGKTTSRDTGLFDMAVNGGEQLVVRFTKQDRLAVQRKREVRVRDTLWVDQVTLVPAQGEETTVELDADEPQVARGGTTEDADGQRQATVIVPSGTGATTGEDGSRPGRLALSATEYTVGENGPQAMPAELPPGTGYTYAAELSARVPEDESGSTPARPLAASASGSVEFDRPVAFYLENFLDFPVGMAVPVGALDRATAAWEPSSDGRVVEMVGTDGGVADLDVDGSGSAASAARLRELQITEEERRELAGMYSAGDTLWRVPIPHFSPWDCNWPYGPPNDAKGPPIRGDEIPEGFFEEGDSILEDTATPTLTGTATRTGTATETEDC